MALLTRSEISPSVFYDGAATWLYAASPAEPLLALCRTQTRADGAYVYALDAPAQRLKLVAWSGLKPTVVDRFQADLAAGADAWTAPRAAIASPVLAWEDIRFRSLPEFVQHQFESVLSLAFGTAPPGFVNLCRREAIPFTPDETAFAASIALGLGNLLRLPDAPDLERQLAELNRRVEDRKLIDRAKRILQDRFGLSEEAAYFGMRRTSRQRRKPMGEIALLVIDSGFVPEARGRETK
jgi:hypothetical protein